MLALLARGFHASWLTILLIVAINTGFAALMSIEDPRPFWHPPISAQCFGLAIAYAVNAASPWDATRPVRRLILAVAIGTVVGYVLVWMIKGQVLGLDGYTLAELVHDSHKFQETLLVPSPTASSSAFSSCSSSARPARSRPCTAPKRSGTCSRSRRSNPS